MTSEPRSSRSTRRQRQDGRKVPENGAFGGRAAGSAMAAMNRCQRINDSAAGGRSPMIRRYVARFVGALDYWFHSSLKAEFGGALNGSVIRRDAFAAIRQACQLQVIVETGTFRGDTTEFFAETGLPVYSVEISPRNFGFSRARLRRRGNVHLFQGDSRSFLK